MPGKDKNTPAEGPATKHAKIPAFARSVTKAFTVSAKAAVQTHKARGEVVVGEVGGIWKSSR